MKTPTYPNLETFLRRTKRSQMSVARDLGISQSHAHRIIRGIYEPPLWLAVEIAHRYNVPVESMVVTPSSHRG